MSARILEGQRINESDKPGACFYDSTTGRAYGPTFEDAEEAEKFLAFLNGADPGDLRWGGPRVYIDNLASGELMYGLWLQNDKEPQRKPFEWTMDYITHIEADEENPEHWSFAVEMSPKEVFPLFIPYECRKIAAVLEKHKVLRKEDDWECESSCVYFRADTEEKAKTFIDRLNVFWKEHWYKAYE